MKILSDDIVVSVKNVSKKFCKNLRRSMAYGIADLSKNLIGIKPDQAELRKDEFWAVDEVGFDLRKGEVLGLIGANGSGKSTLLRLLAGIFPPDKGEISIKGRVGALIAIGAGFHPHMTGRENIFLNGAILGMKKERIDKKFDEILDFSGMADFIDAPISTYSSGMRVKLGFSIAAHIEPDVMLIDEVLAVGDIGFRAKCFNAISDLCKSSAVIFVSHSMPQVARICTDICVLDKGKTMYLGKNINKGMELYYSHFDEIKTVIAGSGKAVIHKIELESIGKKDVKEINHTDQLSIHIHLTVNFQIKRPCIFISFLNQEMQIVAQCNSLHGDFKLHNNGTPIHIKVRFPSLNLNTGVYYISVFVTDENQREILAQHYAAKRIRFSNKFLSIAPVLIDGNWDISSE